MKSRSEQFYDALVSADVQAIKKMLHDERDLAVRAFDESLCTNPPIFMAERVPGYPGHGEKMSASDAKDEVRASTVRLLVEYGSDPNFKYMRGIRPLHMAARFGQQYCIRALVQCGADINARSSAGETPLYRASNLGHLNAVKELVALGADATIRNNKGVLPVDRARKKDAKEIVDLLEQPTAGPAALT